MNMSKLSIVTLCCVFVLVPLVGCGKSEPEEGLNIKKQDSTKQAQEDNTKSPIPPTGDKPILPADAPVHNQHPETAASYTNELFLAIQDGNIDNVKKSIDLGANLETRLDLRHGYYTPLAYAVNQQQNEIVKILLAKGANPNARDQIGWTPLNQAIYWDSVDIVQILIKHGADVNNRDALGDTPLHWAVQSEKKHNKIIEILIKAGASINAKGQIGFTPLHKIAAYPNDNKSIAEFLIQNGANINALNDLGETPLKIASEKGNSNIASLLRQYGAHENLKENSGAIRKYSSSIVITSITKTMSGRTINKNKTMRISIDKGSEDGVYIGLVGYVRIHEAAVNEFRVQEVNWNTAVMEGWYYPNIHEKAKVLLTFGNVSDQAVWDYIKREGIKAPTWKEF